MSKIKGTNAERALINKFWGAGWAALRSAGSGSMHFPSPDIIAGNKIRRLAVEVKATKADRKYFEEEEILQLKNFSGYFGAEPWLAVKFDKEEFMFINPEDLAKSGANWVFSKKENGKSLNFSELIGENQ